MKPKLPGSQMLRSWVRLVAPMTVAGLLWVASSCQRAPETDRSGPPANGELDLRHPSWSGQTMGTIYHIRLAHSPLNANELKHLQQAIQQQLDQVNRQMSHYLPGSELSRFNRTNSIEPFPVSAGFCQVTRFALKLHQASDGAFDPTLGPLINLWGFGEQGDLAHAPTPSQVQTALEQTGARHLKVTPSGALQKTKPDLQLNLSAVAKGYGVDAVASLVQKRGLTNFLVEIGGELAASGRNPAGRPWRIGIDEPVDNALPGERMRNAISISGLAVATSGDYRRFFRDEQGARFSHILDPRTGQPVNHNLASVTVTATNCLEADGLATALLVMGADNGLTFIERWPGAGALFIVRKPDGTFERQTSSRFPRLETLQQDFE